jgi:hypothetical protein
MRKKAQIENQSIFFNFKSPLLYIWSMYVTFFLYKCFFIEIENLNLITNLAFFDFMTH